MSLAAPRSVPREIQAAGLSLGRGEPVLIFDAADREGETDFVFLSSNATAELVRLARHDAGGLICSAISDGLRVRLGLPYYADLLALGSARYPLLEELRRQRLRYDARSAFGVTVNHRTNFTGVPDNDRAATIRAIGELARDAPALSDAQLRGRFASEFASPGHVPLLYAAPALVRERKGHTELAISLARMAALPESVTVCEMLGDSGGPRSPDAARRYAAAHGWPFLTGRAITEAFDRWSG